MPGVMRPEVEQRGGVASPPRHGSGALMSSSRAGVCCSGAVWPARCSTDGASADRALLLVLVGLETNLGTQSFLQ